MNRINVLLIHEEILHKRNRNLYSYYVNEITSPDDNNFSGSPHNNTSFNTFADDGEPIFPVTSQTPSKTRERDQHQLILFLILLSGLHLQVVKVLKTTFYKIFAKIFVKYFTPNLSTLKLIVKTL